MHEPAMPERQLLLVLVAFHPEVEEVERLAQCLEALEPAVGYAVVVNDHRYGEPVERLQDQADLFLTTRQNIGYGRAVNWAWREYRQWALSSGMALPSWIGALNTDLSWLPGTFLRILSWLSQYPEVVLAVPQIRDPEGQIQELCKRNPTLLALASRRFVPERFKPRWLQRYDYRYVMKEADYNRPIAAPYLSGCCMVIASAAFEKVGGFDQRFFLYLEDADLTRALGAHGSTLHLPCAFVTHAWGRGNHGSAWLTLVNLQSAWIYFCKWGWRLW